MVRTLLASKHPTFKAGKAAASAEIGKRRKYEIISTDRIVVPYTLCPWGPEKSNLTINCLKG